ncbi:MAG: OmpA family protein [Clostridium sp.]|nr:OmpA family protein [Clostridium sp.]
MDADIDEQTGKITLDNSILFDYDSYRLSEDGKKYIDSFLRAYAGALLDGEHAEDIKGVQFDGHTDTDGGHEYNQKLSEKRAGAVLEYCTGNNNAGLDSGQTEAFRQISSAVGHSFDEPVYDSDGKIDMAASRRVEIRFFLNLGE